MTNGGRARVGVDVGGTFTKAVACDLETGAVTARAVLPTTHDDPDGVAAGVVRCVAQIAAQIGGANIELVTHSTTQAVNALLEGDVGRVGVLGLGRKPDLRKARKRTCLDRVDLSPGRRLQTSCEFLDVSDGLAPDALERMGGVEVVGRRGDVGVRRRGVRDRGRQPRVDRRRGAARRRPAGLRLV